MSDAVTAMGGGPTYHIMTVTSVVGPLQAAALPVVIDAICNRDVRRDQQLLIMTLLTLCL